MSLPSVFSTLHPPPEMLSFLRRVWQPHLKAPLIAAPGVAIGILIDRLTGPTGQVQLPAKTLTEGILIAGGIVFSLGGVAYSYWKSSQPAERVAAAQNQGRKICECTEDGTIMLFDPKRSGPTMKLFYCPRCNETILKNPNA